MRTYAALAVISAILATVTASVVVSDLDQSSVERQLAPATCGRQCRFKFCDDASAFRFGRADRSFSSAICKIDGTPVGIVGGSREALVEGNTPISQFRPRGLRQNYSPSFFKTFSHTGCADSTAPRRTSGVGHEIPQRNQMKFLNKKCIVLPLRSYQVVDPVTGSVVENIQTNDPLDCLDFRIEVPKILLELTWDSGDDFDLSVTEPSGDVIFWGTGGTPDISPSGSGGTLLLDDRGSCGAPCYNGRERTVYDCGSSPQRGKYTAEVTHFSNCGEGPTRWTLRYFRNGVLRGGKTRTGTDNEFSTAVVGMIMFRI